MSSDTGEGRSREGREGGEGRVCGCKGVSTRIERWRRDAGMRQTGSGQRTRRREVSTLHVSSSGPPFAPSFSFARQSFRLPWNAWFPARTEMRSGRPHPPKRSAVGAPASTKAQRGRGARIHQSAARSGRPRPPKQQRGPGSRGRLGGRTRCCHSIVLDPKPLMTNMVGATGLEPVTPCV